MDGRPRLSSLALSPKDLHEGLAARGHLHLSDIGPREVVDLLESLGPVLHVEDVIVDGRLLMRERKFLHLDEAEVLSSANRAAARSMRAAGLDPTHLESLH